MIGDIKGRPWRLLQLIALAGFAWGFGSSLGSAIADRMTEPLFMVRP